MIDQMIYKLFTFLLTHHLEFVAKWLLKFMPESEPTLDDVCGDWWD